MFRYENRIDIETRARRTDAVCACTWMRGLVVCGGEYAEIRFYTTSGAENSWTKMEIGRVAVMGTNTYGSPVTRRLAPVRMRKYREFDPTE